MNKIWIRPKIWTNMTQKPGDKIPIKQKLTFPDALSRMGQDKNLSAKQHLWGTSAAPAHAGPALGKAE